MPRSSRTAPTPAPQYVTARVGDMHHVQDRINGYSLSRHSTPAEAERAAGDLNASPAAALAAVTLLDAGQTGPAADFRRTLRRFGYAWSLEQCDAFELCSPYALADLVSTGHVRMVWSSQGAPFYTTPERFRRLQVIFHAAEDGDVYPMTPAMALTRRRVRLAAMSDADRRNPCEDHGIAGGRCALCRPREEWECDFAGCSRNAITRVTTFGSSRPACAQCAESFGRIRPRT
ncbi:hypothetical protein ACFV3E_40790 [Streptomyces sp. NPDC059718]